MRVYLDSNVFISWVRGEFGRNLEFMDNAVVNLFLTCSEKNIILVLSDLFYREVEYKAYTNHDEIVYILKEFGDINVQETTTTSDDKIRAKEISTGNQIHFEDAMHVRHAMKSGCDCIITWNMKDFEKTKRLVKALTPREFTQDLSL